MQTQQQQSQLQSLFTYSKPGANVIQISIVRQLDTESQFQKNIFCFLTAVPGEASQQGGRTFNYQNRITMKVDYDKILALGKAIKAYASGKEALFGPFTIYVDTSKSQYGTGGGKSMMLQRGVDNRHNTPVINLFFKTQTSPAIVISMPISEALAFADICEWIGMKALELDFDLASNNFQAKVIPNQPPKKIPTPVQGPYTPQPYRAPQTTAPIPDPNLTPRVDSVVTNFSTGLQDLSDGFDSPF